MINFCFLGLLLNCSGSKYIQLQLMVQIKVTYNAKPKKTENLTVTSYLDLINQIYTVFNIEEGGIKFMKPRLKDEESFAKEVKQGSEVLIVGALRKQKTEQEIKKEKEQEEELRKMKEELKMNPHEKIVKHLKEKGIKERGIEYFNVQINEPEDLGIQYALCPLYMLKFATQFKNFCTKYQCMQKNPDGLIIQELGKIFKEMDKEQGVVCPLQWISAWICYCSDDIQYPYPTYPIEYFLNRLFGTIKMAFDVELQKKEEEPNSRVDLGTKNFGLQVLTKRTDLTKLDEDETETEKQIDKKAIKYFLQCDLGKPEFSSVFSGIRQRFKEKTLWRNFYAFDIQYKQKIISIEKLPKYLFIQCSRWGYTQARQEWEEVEFNEGEKSYHNVRINRVLDLYDLCDANLKDKLDQGRYQRDQMFYPYHMDERYPAFCQTIKHLQMLEDNEVKYQFLDWILFKKDIYHQFWFQTIKNSKPTGQYRLVGVVLHKGHYYHRPNQTHKHNCKGDFMTIMYKKGKDWVKYHRAEVEIVEIDQATNPQYWGKQGGWTPILLMYKEIYMRNIQVEPPNEPRKDRTTRTRKNRQ